MPDKKLIIGLVGPIWEGAERQATMRYLEKSFGFYPISPFMVVRKAARKLYKWDGNLDASGKSVLEHMCSSGRSIARDYWLSLALMRVPKDKNRIVINDIFFEDEVDFVAKSGGLILFFPNEKDPEPSHWEFMSEKYPIKNVPKGVSAEWQESVLKPLVDGFCI